MKKLAIGFMLFCFSICVLTSCSSPVNNEHIEIAKHKCAPFGGWKELEVVQNSDFVGNMYCNDGTVIAGFQFRRTK